LGGVGTKAGGNRKSTGILGRHAVDPRTVRLPGNPDLCARSASAIVTRQGGDGFPERGKKEPAPRAQRVERGPTPAQSGGGRRPETSG
jgi:hypothetical protein